MGSCASKSSGNFGGIKRTRKTFSDHVSAFQHSSSVPNRIFANGKSQSSCIFTQQGRKGINQDAMIVWEDFMTDDVTFCGVFDGHGPHGHLVARKVRDTLPVKLFSFLDSYESKKNRSSSYICCNEGSGLDAGDGEEEEEKPDLLWREAFLKSYKSMDKELKSHPNLDCFCSGSTAVTIVKQGSNLFIGSIGDSRAIMASKDVNDSLVAVQLTVDLKPDLPREAERIKRCKGRVFALQDEPEVPRVWLPFDDAPGLAMARAFGDFCLKEYGVISIPEISHRILTERDKFIVLASDGVPTGLGPEKLFISRDGALGTASLIWDVLTNEHVIEIVSSAPTRSSAARLLVDSAAREWKTKYPTSKMDDCAVVCLFLDGKMDAESDNEEHGLSSTTLQSNAGESDDGQNPEPFLQRNFTVRSSEDKSTGGVRVVEQNDIVLEGNGEETETSVGANEDQNWSGLEGVTRVNSLVQLPRFSKEQQRT